jgi:hypothetical protein
MRGPFPLVLDPAPAQVNRPVPTSQQRQVAPVVDNENTRFAGGGAAAGEQPVAANLETETPGPKPRSVARKRKPSYRKSQPCRTGTDDIEATKQLVRLARAILYAVCITGGTLILLASVTLYVVIGKTGRRKR